MYGGGEVVVYSQTRRMNKKTTRLISGKFSPTASYHK